MTKAEAITALKEIIKRCKDDPNHYDAEDAHSDADTVLLEYINDKEIEAAWDDVPKWYS